MSTIGGILLCAGLGSRLAPLTNLIPKPAIPFCGVPMAHYARKSLENAGISELGMNVHHLPEQMIHAMNDGKWLNASRDILISRESQILGTGGGSAKLARMMPNCHQFIIYHGDVLCAADLTNALQSHNDSGADVTLVVLPRPEQIHENVRKSLGMIGVKNHEIICIRDWFKLNSPSTDYEPRCFAGIHIVERKVLDRIAPDQNVCLVTQIYRQMLESGSPIHAYEPDTPVFFADVGTPATYLDAQARCLAHFAATKSSPGSLNLLATGHMLNHSQSPSFSFSTSPLPDSLHIGDNVCIHSGAQIPPNGSLNHEMLCQNGGIRLDGAWIHD